MNNDFNLGRNYEKAEILILLEALKGVDDMAQLHSMLESWQTEIINSLPRVKIIHESTTTTIV